jgi:hypothetical protein
MTTPRRQAIALAGVLAATTVTGGALVMALTSRAPSATPPALHARTAVKTPRFAATPPVQAPRQFAEYEEGDR